MVRQIAALVLLAAALQAPPPAARVNAAFDEAYAQLKHGRTYSKDVSTGTLRKRHGQFSYWLTIPDAYDPARKFQVRIQLHGGVMRPEPALRGDGTVARLPAPNRSTSSPAGWSEAPWWSDQQVANLRAILEDVKRNYNVDENRVVAPACPTAAPARTTSPCATRRPMRRSCRSTGT